MVAVKIGAILTFWLSEDAVKPAQLDALRAFWLRRNRDRRRDRLLHLHRIRFRLNRGGGVAQPGKDLPLTLIMSPTGWTLLYVGAAVVLLGMMKYTTFVSRKQPLEAPVAYGDEHLSVPFSGW